MDEEAGVGRLLTRQLSATFAVRIARDAPSRTEGPGVIQDRVKRRADLRVFQQTSHSHSDDVVDALVGREGESSNESVLAFWEPQGQSL